MTKEVGARAAPPLSEVTVYYDTNLQKFCMYNNKTRKSREIGDFVDLKSTMESAHILAPGKIRFHVHEAQARLRGLAAKYLNMVEDISNLPTTSETETGA